jgi:hypothetical protein
MPTYNTPASPVGAMRSRAHAALEPVARRGSTCGVHSGAVRATGRAELRYPLVLIVCRVTGGGARAAAHPSDWRGRRRDRALARAAGRPAQHGGGANQLVSFPGPTLPRRRRQTTRTQHVGRRGAGLHSTASSRYHRPVHDCARPCRTTSSLYRRPRSRPARLADDDADPSAAAAPFDAAARRASTQRPSTTPASFSPQLPAPRASAAAVPAATAASRGGYAPYP